MNSPLTRGGQAIQALGVAAGAVAVLYGIGGIVQSFRFAGHDLPLGASIALVPARQLLLTGAIVTAVVLVAEAAVWASFKLIERLVDRNRRRKLQAAGASGSDESPATPAAADASPEQVAREEDPDTTGAEEGEEDADAREVARGALGGASVGAGSTTLAALFSSIVLEASVFGLLRAVLAAGIITGAAVAISVLTAPKLIGAGWSGLRRIPAKALLIFTLLVIPVTGASLAYFLPLRLPEANVRLKDGSCVAGAYLGRDSSGIHLVDGPSRDLLTIDRRRLVTIQVGDAVEVGDKRVHRSGCPLPN